MTADHTLVSAEDLGLAHLADNARYTLPDLERAGALWTMCELETDGFLFPRYAKGKPVCGICTEAANGGAADDRN